MKTHSIENPFLHATACLLTPSSAISAFHEPVSHISALWLWKLMALCLSGASGVSYWLLSGRSVPEIPLKWHLDCTNPLSVLIYLCSFCFTLMGAPAVG